MKKLFISLALLVFLFGCTFQTPWGDFKVKPDQNLSGVGVAPGTGSGSNLSGSPSSGESMVFFEPGAGSFILEIDGVTNSVYDSVGVVLRSGETADASNWQTLFAGDYPAHSPRDLVIKSRVIFQRDLSNWRDTVTQTGYGYPGVQRKNMALVILDAGHNPVGRITYANAWPSAYSVLSSPSAFEEQVVISSESVRVETS